MFLHIETPFSRNVKPPKRKNFARLRKRPAAGGGAAPEDAGTGRGGRPAAGAGGAEPHGGTKRLAGIDFAGTRG